MDEEEIRRQEIEAEQRREESRRARAYAVRELSGVKSDLQSIINELDSIAFGVRQDFAGIGNELCASKIEDVVEQYRWAIKELDRIN